MDFGQRDHVAFVLFLPALVWLPGRKYGAGTTVAGWCIVVAAAIGLLIKPYPYRAGDGPGLCSSPCRGARMAAVDRAADLGFALIACLYAGLVVVVFPEWFEVARIARAALQRLRRRCLDHQSHDFLDSGDRRPGNGEQTVRQSLGKAARRNPGRCGHGPLGSYVLQHKGIDYISSRPGCWCGCSSGFVDLGGRQMGLDARVAAAAADMGGEAPARRYGAIALCLLSVLPLWANHRPNGDRCAQHGPVDAGDDRRVAGPSHWTARGRVRQQRVSRLSTVDVPRDAAAQPLLAQPWLIPWVTRQEQAGLANAPETLKMAADMEQWSSRTSSASGPMGSS